MSDADGGSAAGLAEEGRGDLVELPEVEPAAEEAGRQGQETRARQQDGDMASQGNDVEDGEEENRDGDERQDEDSQSAVPAV